jgi:predicted component of type VI protein secretion system
VDMKCPTEIAISDRREASWRRTASCRSSIVRTGFRHVIGAVAGQKPFAYDPDATARPICRGAPSSRAAGLPTI